MKPTLLLPLFLTACINLPQQAVSITRHEVTLEEVHKMCWRYTTPLGGCALLSTDKQRCDIYVPKKSEYAKIRSNVKGIDHLTDLHIELYFLGHETKHCFDGAWH